MNEDRRRNPNSNSRNCAEHHQIVSAIYTRYFESWYWGGIPIIWDKVNKTFILPSFGKDSRFHVPWQSLGSLLPSSRRHPSNQWFRSSIWFFGDDSHAWEPEARMGTSILNDHEPVEMWPNQPRRILSTSELRWWRDRLQAREMNWERTRLGERKRILGRRAPCSSDANSGYARRGMEYEAVDEQSRTRLQCTRHSERVFQRKLE